MKLFVLFCFGVFVIELLLNLFATPARPDSQVLAHQALTDAERIRDANTNAARCDELPSEDEGR